MANLKIPNHHQRWWLLRDFVPSGTGLLDTPSGLRPAEPTAPSVPPPPEVGASRKWSDGRQWLVPLAGGEWGRSDTVSGEGRSRSSAGLSKEVSSTRPTRNWPRSLTILKHPGAVAYTLQSWSRGVITRRPRSVRQDLRLTRNDETAKATTTAPCRSFLVDSSRIPCRLIPPLSQGAVAPGDRVDY
jgi:hypothetical protein